MDVLRPVTSPITPRRRATPISRRIDQVRQASGRLRAASGGTVARRCAACCRTRRRSPGRPFDESAIAERYPDRAHEEQAGGRLALVLRAGWRAQPPRRASRQGDGRWRAATAPSCAPARACCSTRRRCARPAGCTGSSPRCSRSATPRSTGYSRRRATPTTSPARAGLRILIEAGAGWQLLAEPSVFEMGLSDCRWIYRLEERTVTVRALASGDDPAMQWRVAVEGAPCRFLVFGGLVLGEREFDHAGRVEIDADKRRIAFRPDPASLWGQRYPDAVYHLVTSTPDAIEAIGGDELLYADGQPRGGGCRGAADAADGRARLRRRRRAGRPGGARSGSRRSTPGASTMPRASRPPRATGAASPATCA